MKKVVKTLNVIALALFMTGGAALDGKSIVIPMLMITPAALWFAAIAWVNR